ncbi:hypothetical protein [Marinobacter nauticus]|uniref:hypothetical protein n=1 Tax=Marinobacter nauticus TaxID=2743 RepID=UPI003735554E
MKLIDWIADGLNRWRKRIENMQYNDGVTWAYSAYYDSGWSLEEVENQSHPFGGGPRNAFERGVLQAVLTIEAQLAAKNLRTNQNGEPVDVPFFIHPLYNETEVERWRERVHEPPECDECGGTGVIYEGGMSMNPEVDNQVPCPTCK